MKKTKQLLLLLQLLFISQLPADAATEDVITFETGGINVILKPSVKEVISVSWVLQGGTANYSKQQEGIEALAMTMVAQRGPTHLSKAEWHSALNKMGTTVSGKSTYDYSSISMNCLVKHFDHSWNLMTDAILRPAFDSTDFSNAKQKAIGAAKRAETDPDTYIRYLAMGLAWQGEDYSKISSGTVASLEPLLLETVKSHYEKNNTKSQGFLVVVGNITRASLIAKIDSSLATLPQGAFSTKPAKNLVVSVSGIIKAEREIATNYLRGMMGAPPNGTREEAAMKVAATILYDRLYMEIRGKRNLSYAPGFYAPNLKNTYTFLYVSTDSPSTCAKVMLSEIETVKTSGFTETELENKKSRFLTRHYMRLETNASQAEMLTMAYLQGDVGKTNRFVDQVFSLSLNEVNAVVKKYLDGVNWAFLGDLKMLEAGVFGGK